MTRIIALATAWGSAHGGINAFNTDLCVGLAQELGDAGKVYCAVIAGEGKAGEDEFRLACEDAARQGVTLVPITRPDRGQAFDPSWAREVAAWLEAHGAEGHPSYWIGHDVKSGEAALLGAQLTNGSAALVGHMAYLLYGGHKRDDATTKQHQDQMRTFRSRAHVFAVGPLLRDWLSERLNRPVTMLVPGFPTRTERPRARRRLAGITFGRLGVDDDRIKQGRLAVLGFANAIKVLSLTPTHADLVNGHFFIMLGVDDARPQVQDLKRRAFVEAGRSVNMFAEPYQMVRRDVFDRVGGASFAMMLSVHEGFGLTAWEAIGLGVPVILSRNSGVFQLLQEAPNAAASRVQVIDVQGPGDASGENHTRSDIEAVSRAIQGIALDFEHAYQDAGELYGILQQRYGCTWSGTARALLDAMADASLAEPNPEPNSEPGRPPSSSGQARGRDAAVVAERPWNAHADLLELGLSIMQGSDRSRFDLMPELRCTVLSFPMSGERQARIGLTGVRVSVRCDGSVEILPGNRLGDDGGASDVVAWSGGRWDISGPCEEGFLAHRVLGRDRLCELGARDHLPGGAAVEVTAAKAELDVRLYDRDGRRLALPDDTQAALGLVLGKGLGGGSRIQLARAGVSVKGADDGPA